MPARTSRVQRLLWIDRTVWQQAKTRAADDHLTPARALEVLLDSYTAGRVTITPVTRTHNGGGGAREQRRVSLATHVIERVIDPDGKLKRDDAPSLSRLAETLLDGYATGQITMTVTASGHVDKAQPPEPTDAGH